MFKLGATVIVTALVIATIGRTIFDATLRQAVRKSYCR